MKNLAVTLILSFILIGCGEMQKPMGESKVSEHDAQSAIDLTESYQMNESLLFSVKEEVEDPDSELNQESEAKIELVQLCIISPEEDETIHDVELIVKNSETDDYAILSLSVENGKKPVLLQGRGVLASETQFPKDTDANMYFNPKAILIVSEMSPEDEDGVHPAFLIGDTAFGFLSDPAVCIDRERLEKESDSESSEETDTTDGQGNDSN